ncbi:macro domain-containing protein [Salipaludibacillus aurantiacus]|uniref:O-acetyl-ADP-ribose deacetylase (Regulator of RNase III), contains Macro domain n=1 Tax=Salipaludibacillus aurantiacus TaxID=1601833 RepID=A0A1H9UB39_9BACI|nr:macro domain-containing protein [Salipaludibacillus aurantiacus]SES06387.1 O-acetyl-ADP-ribose deacetylase (regulator of RNase III), contains Macro domain [Salipaludibacillus aurantiacus]
MQWTVNGKTIEVTQGNIAAQEDMAAVVNAANAQLVTGGGVAGALHTAAGPELAEAGQKYAPIKPGEAVLTLAFNLPNDAVIHCLGPVYGKDKPEDRLLASCYERALYLAEQEELGSVAFPAISTGVFGYPFDDALDMAVSAVLNKLGGLKHVNTVRFVLFSEQEAEKYREYMDHRIN